MGIYLNVDGELTVSQRIHADALGIPHEVFKKQLLKRIQEIRGGPPPKTERRKEMVRNVVKADNPVLVVGAGPSHKTSFEQIGKFSGKVVVLDINFNSCVEHGIIPDYVITLECGKLNVPPEFFKPENVGKCTGKTVFVGSSITRRVIGEHITKGGGTFTRWDFPEEPRASNAGLFAICFTKMKLEADKIFMVGFEHVGDKYPESTYITWQTDFWYFIRKWDKETMVNCSNGGALYYEDYVIDADLGVRIEARNNNTS